jgi:hypothetical protein
MSATWKPCPGYEGIYAVSDQGRVMRVAPGKGTRVGRILSPVIDHYGYPFVNLSHRPKKLHQLVCEAFHGPRPSLRHGVAHADGNPRNNRAGNLRWATQRENLADAIVHGTSRRGRSKSALLSDDAARVIKVLLAQGVMQRVIAARYGVARTTINNIAIGKNWRHV